MSNRPISILLAGTALLLACSQKMEFQPEAVSVRRRTAVSYWNSAVPLGDKSFVVILAFSDLFTVHQGSGKSLYNFYDAFLNGHAADGTTARSIGLKGSAREYWKDNSNGAFLPRFHVLTMDGNCFKNSLEYYGTDSSVMGSDTHTGELYYEVVTHFHEELEGFRNNPEFVEEDGELSSLIILYPGYGQSAFPYRGNLIWPGAGRTYAPALIEYSGLRFHTKMLCCEFSASGKPDLGTFCHEFAHVIGLPDVYDTDGSTNGTATSLPGAYSLMGLGLGKAGGTCPPCLTSVEKDIYMGDIWGQSPVEPANGQFTELRPVSSGDFIRIENRSGGEYIYVEYRNGKGWDSLLKPNVLVYHVDRSANKVGPVSAGERWKHGAMLNAFASHPCYYKLSGDEPLNPLDWGGEPFGRRITLERPFTAQAARVGIM